jgi:hypothetical protein
LISALTYRKLIRYVDGRIQKLHAPGPNTSKDVKERFDTDLEAWEIGNEHARSILLSTLPETYQIKIIGLDSAMDGWDTIKSKFDNQSEMVQIDLLRQMNQTRCAEDADPRETIQTLQAL